MEFRPCWITALKDLVKQVNLSTSFFVRSGSYFKLWIREVVVKWCVGGPTQIHNIDKGPFLSFPPTESTHMA